jgi:hypothetical protein
MIIMFIISATTSVGAVSCLVSTSFYVVDTKVRLRLDRVHERDKSNSWSRRLARRLARVRAGFLTACPALAACLDSNSRRCLVWSCARVETLRERQL